LSEKELPTLADDLASYSLSKLGRITGKHSWLAHRVAVARKFVLDRNMSAFLSDLAHA
jgi:hypothetical protein